MVHILLHQVCIIIFGGNEAQWPQMVGSEYCYWSFNLVVFSDKNWKLTDCKDKKEKGKNIKVIE